jgi:hypothetical protein
MRAELVALLERTPRRIVRIVNRDGLSAMLPHHGETRHVGRTVADVIMCSNGTGRSSSRHVIIHILRVIEHPLLIRKRNCVFCVWTDDAARKRDPSFAVLRKFATEDRAHVRREDASRRSAPSVRSR